MGRPVKCRRVHATVTAACFSPQCIPLCGLEEITLELEELEALRLADLEGLYQADAALNMGISRQTFGRIIAVARKKVASAIVNGKGLRITSSHASEKIEGVKRSACP